MVWASRDLRGILEEAVVAVLLPCNGYMPSVSEDPTEATTHRRALHPTQGSNYSCLTFQMRNTYQ
jgi:hypothetical protein